MIDLTINYTDGTMSTSHHCEEVVVSNSGANNAYIVTFILDQTKAVSVGISSIIVSTEACMVCYSNYKLDNIILSSDVAIESFGYDHGWRVDRHPRMMADITGNGRSDMIGFGNQGVFVATAYSHGEAVFNDRKVVLPNAFDYNTGWRVDQHPRMMADITGDGKADIVGFGNQGIFTAVSNGNGTFDYKGVAYNQQFGYNHGWRVDQHPRMMADINGDGKADVVGFGIQGVLAATSNGNGYFTHNNVVIDHYFGYDHGWRVEKHPRMMADITGDGKADVVGFGNQGIFTAISNGDASFDYKGVTFSQSFGYNHGWKVAQHPRMMADINGDGKADVVGFGNQGIFTALSNGNGTFDYKGIVLNQFGHDQNWRVERHPRMVADVNGDGMADIIGFGGDGVYVAISNGDGTFAFQEKVQDGFGYNNSWRENLHQRFIADVDGNGRADIIGAHNRGVHISLIK